MKLSIGAKCYLRRISLTVSMLVLLPILTGCSMSDLLNKNAEWPPKNWRQSEFGSFSPDVTASFDKKYYTVQTLENKEGSKTAYIRVTIYDSVTNAVVDSFLTERAFDFWGVCWDPKNYDLWIQSNDVGTYCMCFMDGHWVRDVDDSYVFYYKDGVSYQEVSHPRHLPDEIIDRFKMNNGSFEYNNVYNQDGKYYAGKGSYWDESSQRFIHGIEICEMTDGLSKRVFFYTLSYEIYRGVCWERDQNNLWVRLEDTVFCLRYDNGTWRREDSAKRPEYIALAYNWDGTIKK